MQPRANFCLVSIRMTKILLLAPRAGMCLHYVNLSWMGWLTRTIGLVPAAFFSDTRIAFCSRLARLLITIMMKIAHNEQYAQQLCKPINRQWTNNENIRSRHVVSMHNTASAMLLTHCLLIQRPNLRAQRKEL